MLQFQLHLSYTTKMTINMNSQIFVKTLACVLTCKLILMPFYSLLLCKSALSDTPVFLPTAYTPKELEDSSKYIQSNFLALQLLAYAGSFWMPE